MSTHVGYLLWNHKGTQSHQTKHGAATHDHEGRMDVWSGGSPKHTAYGPGRQLARGVHSMRVSEYVWVCVGVCTECTVNSKRKRLKAPDAVEISLW